MKLSVIIALYNTENYIEKCIKSVAEQDLSPNDYEIIVVNDGSTDGSLEVVNRLKEKYNNLIVITKENGGQSSARNIGFNVSNGNYIFCLDSDDFISENSLKFIIDKLASYDLDMLAFSFKNISENGTVIVKLKETYVESDGVMTGGEFMNTFSVSGTMWMYIYKRTVIVDNRLKLIEGVFHEDEDFVIRFLSYAKRVKYFNFELYNYLIRSNSTVNNKSMSHRIKLIYDIITVVLSLEDRMKDVMMEEPLTYKGIAIKKEQLLVSICQRILKERYPKSEVKSILDFMQEKQLYPLNLKYSKFTFKLFALFANSRSLLLFNK